MTGDVQQGSWPLTRHDVAYQACLAEMQSLPEAKIQRVRTYRWRSSVPVLRRTQHTAVAAHCVPGLEH